MSTTEEQLISLVEAVNDLVEEVSVKKRVIFDTEATVVDAHDEIMAVYDLVSEMDVPGKVDQVAQDAEKVAEDKEFVESLVAGDTTWSFTATEEGQTVFGFPERLLTTPLVFHEGSAVTGFTIDQDALRLIMPYGVRLGDEILIYARGLVGAQMASVDEILAARDEVVVAADRVEMASTLATSTFTTVADQREYAVQFNGRQVDLRTGAWVEEPDGRTLVVGQDYTITPEGLLSLAYEPDDGQQYVVKFMPRFTDSEAGASTVEAMQRAEAAAADAVISAPFVVDSASAFFGKTETVLGAKYLRKQGGWEVVAPGAGLWDHPTTGDGIKPLQSENGWNILDFGADRLGISDSTTAFQLARAAMVLWGGVTYVPDGVYLLSENISLARSGCGFSGSTVGGAIIKATVDFTVGDFMFTFGNKETSDVVTSMTFRGFTLDLSDAPGCGGYEHYGIRDTGSVRDIYVKDNTLLPGFKTGQAGAGPGGAARRMCEGNSLQNIWVIGGPWTGGYGIMLDGILESNFIGGGVRGYSSRLNENATGIGIGTYSETRAMTLMGATVVMLKDPKPGTARTNLGIRYGEHARECQDVFTTFEGITGEAVKFDGAGGLPVRCRTLKPRVYAYSAGGDDEGWNADNYFAKSFIFGKCQYCFAELDGYSAGKVWAEFEGTHGADHRGNSFRGDHTNTAEYILANNVIFVAGSDATNYAHGVGAGEGYWASPRGRSAISGVTASGVAFIKTPSASGQIIAQDGSVALEWNNANVIPRKPFRNMRITRYGLVYSASITPNMAQGADQSIPVNNLSAFAINAPTNVLDGETLYLTFRNFSSGMMGNVTFDPVFKVAGGNLWSTADGGVLSKPSGGTSRCITFRWTGTNWIEIGRTPADVPN